MVAVSGTSVVAFARAAMSQDATDATPPPAPSAPQRRAKVPLLIAMTLSLAALTGVVAYQWNEARESAERECRLKLDIEAAREEAQRLRDGSQKDRLAALAAADNAFRLWDDPAL